MNKGKAPNSANKPKTSNPPTRTAQGKTGAGAKAPVKVAPVIKENFLEKKKKELQQLKSELLVLQDQKSKLPHPHSLRIKEPLSLSNLNVKSPRSKSIQLNSPGQNISRPLSRSSKASKANLGSVLISEIGIESFGNIYCSKIAINIY